MNKTRAVKRQKSEQWDATEMTTAAAVPCVLVTRSLDKWSWKTVHSPLRRHAAGWLWDLRSSEQGPTELPLALWEAVPSGFCWWCAEIPWGRYKDYNLKDTGNWRHLLLCKQLLCSKWSTISRVALIRSGNKHINKRKQDSFLLCFLISLSLPTQ